MCQKVRIGQNVLTFQTCPHSQGLELKIGSNKDASTHTHTKMQMQGKAMSCGGVGEVGKGEVIQSSSNGLFFWAEVVKKSTHTHKHAHTYACILNPRSIWVSLKCSCVCLSSTHGKHIRDREREPTVCWICLPQYIQKNYHTSSLSKIHIAHFGGHSDTNLDIHCNAAL